MAPHLGIHLHHLLRPLEDKILEFKHPLLPATNCLPLEPQLQLLLLSYQTILSILSNISVIPPGLPIYASIPLSQTGLIGAVDSDYYANVRDLASGLRAPSPLQMRPLMFVVIMSGPSMMILSKPLSCNTFANRITRIYTISLVPMPCFPNCVNTMKS